MKKIVLIGAGSTQFGLGTIADIFKSKVLEGSTISLHDINSEALKNTKEIADKYKEELNAKYKIEATTNLNDALKGANFCIISIEIGDRFKLWEQDWKIPLDHGLNQIFGENGGPQVNIELDSDGARAMVNATEGNIGRNLGVVLIEEITKTYFDEEGKVIQEKDTVEQVISNATIQDVLGARFRITGLGSTQEARDLALLLRAGALAAPMTFVEEQTIGPTLGQENIEKGVNSVIIGFILVFIFMLIRYRLFGLSANIALMSNLILVTAIMSAVGATLTLPGIAGIVLTVGMAVDANVLIFARISEELKAHIDPQNAIKNGFSKAFSTIMDANITTLLVALILYAIGTGPIKGFAVTLSIGIVTSIFTAILVTRSLVNFIYGYRRVEELKV